MYRRYYTYNTRSKKNMHAINKDDKGYVKGTTWHNMPQYIQQTTAVTEEQALEVLSYNLKKRPLFREVNGKRSQSNVYEVYREDTGSVLVDSVTETYDLINNDRLFDYINTTVLKNAPDIEIESVGTLFSGQTAFVNLLLGSYEIKGDISSTLNRLMYYNPLGKGSYKTCAHNVRVVCNNTVRAAQAQGAANGTLVKVRHTKNADKMLETAIDNILGIKKGFEDLQNTLVTLTTKEFNLNLIEEIIANNFFYSNPNDKQIARAVSNIEEVYENTKEEYAPSIRTSRYALFQSFTNFIDHKGRSDEGYKAWDGLTGIRANLKDNIFNDLLIS